MSFQIKTRKTFSCLADVEVACINHFLDARTILVLARCSRRLLHQAQQPFSFRFAPPLAIDSRRLALLPSSPSALQHRLSLSISWFCDSKDKIVDLLRALTLHKDALNVVELSPSLSKHLHPDQWVRALRLPCCRSLRTLKLTTDIPNDFGTLTTDLIAALATLPSLSSLTFWPSHHNWQRLPEMPALTDVTVNHYYPPSEASLGYLALCKGISSLSIRHPSHLAAFDVARMLCSPSLGASLRILTLERLFVQAFLGYEDRVADWARALSNLTALETLKLFRVDPVAKLLEHVGLLKSSLRLLECSTDCAGSFDTKGHLPAPETAASLLVSMPSLRVRVVVMFATCPDRELAAMRAHVQQYRSAPELQKSRFTLKTG